MVSEFERITISDALEFVSDKIPPNSVLINQYVSTENLVPDFGGVTLAASVPSKGKVCRFRKDDILFSNIRTYFKKLWFCSYEGACSNDVIVFRAKKGVFPKFVFYSLMSDEFIDYTVKTSKGTKMPRGDKAAIAKYSFTLPSIPEQKTIAHILGSLDDKIELNRKMNSTLESMAQVLFKSWFVDFDPVIDKALAAGNPIPEPLHKRAEIRRQLGDKRKSLPVDIEKHSPSSFVFNEELGWIPEGWEVDDVSCVASEVFSGGTPNTRKSEFWNGNLNWFSSGETREFLVIDTQKAITLLGVSSSSTKLCKFGDILIASAGQGHTRGQTSFCTIDTYINQSVVCVRPKSNDFRAWLFCNLYSRYQEMRAISDSHSIRGSLTTKLIRKFPVLIPSERLLPFFSESIDIYFAKIKKNLIEINILSSLRDTLLPKLISGELRVPDAEKLVEKVL